MDDRDYERYVRFNLPHARTIVQRIGRSLQALGALPDEEEAKGELQEALRALEETLRDFDEDPGAEIAFPAADAAAAAGRRLVDTIKETPWRADRLGQHVRNLFECLGAPDLGATLSLQCGERPDSPMR